MSASTMSLRKTGVERPNNHVDSLLVKRRVFKGHCLSLEFLEGKSFQPPYIVFLPETI